MALIDTLGAAAAVPISGSDLRLDFSLLAPSDHSPFEGGGPTAPDRANPRVSCLMVTTGRRAVIRHSLECYRRQAYENRELVVVTQPDGLQAVSDFVADSGAANVAIHCVGPEMTLGDCRNVSIARSRGEMLMHWDDDDLYDPLRITAAVALLSQSRAAAALLARVLIWWPRRRIAAISKRRLWEGTITVLREYAPAYPSLAKGEDTPPVSALARTRPIATYDFPLLYVYTVHAGNTWDTRHFEEMFEKAECVIQDEDYVELIHLLSARMPVLEYEADAARAEAGGRPPWL
ncbi:MAG TPA: glycosyltransferase family A protein [Caulobacteraceae bacterium]|jgi:glycosyltransferase involved in cell wall biosynthesis|nr:glycosyltransferase family A protein [Caulobacteraceae bacterium]